MEEAYQNVSIPINAALLSASEDKIYTTDNPPPVFSSCMFLMWLLYLLIYFFFICHSTLIKPAQSCVKN